MRAARGNRRGFVLLATLWLLVALGAVGLDAALRSRERRLAAANLVDRTRAAEIATAGAEYARSRLTAAMLGRAEEIRSEILAQTTNDRARASVRQTPSTILARAGDPFDDPWRVPQQLVSPEIDLGDASCTLRLRDAGAALNLNTVDEDGLRRFFAGGLRLDFADADRLTQAILDWRDEDDIPRLNGGERDRYMKERRAVLPGNGPFGEPDEVRDVLGMTAEVFERARPYLTVVGDGRVNVNAAPEPVLLALPGMTEAIAAEIVRLRQSGGLPRALPELEGLLPAGAAAALEAHRRELQRRATFATDEVEIVAQGRVRDSPVRATVHLVVGRAPTEATVVWWRLE